LLYNNSMGKIRDRINEFNKGVPLFLLKVKYKRMSENAFRFFRGTCHLFYEDLSSRNPFPPSPTSWITGDLHLENFGTYKGDNGLVYFDVNDFNEAVLAPLTWEIARMTTSIFVAFDDIQIGHRETEELVSLFLKTYSSVLAVGKPRYIEAKIAKGIVKDFLERVSERSLAELLDGRVCKKGKELRFCIDGERHLKLEPGLRDKLREFIDDWIRSNHPKYRCMDIAFRIAGTGSVGVKRYVFLLKHLEKEKNYLMLDMKHATHSSLERFTPAKQPRWMNEGDRMVSVQQYMQNVNPALLSFVSFDREPFLIKKLQPSEDRVDFKGLKKRDKDMSQVIKEMAALAASAHLRSAARKGAATPDELMTFGSSGSWHNDIINFSREYSRQVKAYHYEFIRE
jgi:uncharacterized protein (DUF2252 family)